MYTVNKHTVYVAIDNGGGKGQQKVQGIKNDQHNFRANLAHIVDAVRALAVI